MKQVACPELDRHQYHALGIQNHRKVRYEPRKTRYSVPVFRAQRIGLSRKASQSAHFSAAVCPDGNDPVSPRVPEPLKIVSKNANGTLLTASLDSWVPAPLPTRVKPAQDIDTTEVNYYQDDEVPDWDKINDIDQDYQDDIRSHPAWHYAKAAKVLGILSLFIVPVVTGTLGIIFGAIALERLKTSPEWQIHRMAKVGLICGIIGLASVIVLGYVIILMG